MSSSTASIDALTKGWPLWRDFTDAERGQLMLVCALAQSPSSEDQQAAMETVSALSRLMTAKKTDTIDGVKMSLYMNDLRGTLSVLAERAKDLQLKEVEVGAAIEMLRVERVKLKTPTTSDFADLTTRVHSSGIGERDSSDGYTLLTLPRDASRVDQRAASTAARVDQRVANLEAKMETMRLGGEDDEPSSSSSSSASARLMDAKRQLDRKEKELRTSSSSSSADARLADARRQLDDQTELINRMREDTIEPRPLARQLSADSDAPTPMSSDYGLSDVFGTEPYNIKANWTAIFYAREGLAAELDAATTEATGIMATSNYIGNQITYICLETSRRGNQNGGPVSEHQYHMMREMVSTLEGIQKRAPRLSCWARIGQPSRVVACLMGRYGTTRFTDDECVKLLQFFFEQLRIGVDKGQAPAAKQATATTAKNTGV